MDIRIYCYSSIFLLYCVIFSTIFAGIVGSPLFESNTNHRRRKAIEQHSVVRRPKTGLKFVNA